MRKILSFCATSALVLLVGSPAFASDLPDRVQAPAPAQPMPAPSFTPATPQLYSWTGFSIGIEGGMGSANFDQTTSAFDPYMPVGLNPVTTNAMTGALGGIRAGYDYQMGSLVVGIQGALDYSNVNVQQTAPVSGGTLSGSGQVNGIGTAQLLLGYAADRFMLFATGGYAGAKYSLTNTFSPNSGAAPSSNTDSQYLNGAAFSIGGAYAVTSNISVSVALEKDLLGTALTNAFGTSSTTSTTTATTTSSASSNMGVNMTEVKVGVDYRF